MITKEQAEKLLNEMGQTADEVAAFLKAKGVKGKKTEALSCPVINYLISQGADQGDSIYDRYNSDEYHVLTPDPVFSFIVDFDGGGYPELESE